MTEEIEEEYKEQDPVTVCKWEFDQWSTAHWEEKRQGNVDKTKSWIDFSDTENGQRVTVITNQKPGLTIDADRDMWGHMDYVQDWRIFSYNCSRGRHHVVYRRSDCVSDEAQRNYGL
jgi:hypothetical protein